MHVIDPFNPETKSPSESLKLILKELKNYSHVFNVKKHIICINKSDLLDMTNKPELTKITRPLKRILKEAPVFFISAATGFGLQDLKNYLLQTHCSETIQ